MFVGIVSTGKEDGAGEDLVLLVGVSARVSLIAKLIRIVLAPAIANRIKKLSWSDGVAMFSGSKNSTLDDVKGIPSPVFDLNPHECCEFVKVFNLAGVERNPCAGTVARGP